MKTNKKESWKIFEKIAHRYDIANRILSLGIDKLWRKKVISLIPDEEVGVLDLATGTGDLLLEIVQNRKRIKRAVGVDMSPQMLKLAEKKALDRGIYDRCSFRIGDITYLHFKNLEWDWITIAFGIRNTPDTLKVLQEMRRVLKKKGKVIILEFSLPSQIWLRWLYLFYFRYLLPVFGFFITGHYAAYRYLNSTVESYPHGEKFLSLMRKAGFERSYSISLTFGIASIYIGHK